MTATLPLPALRDRTTLRLGGSPWAWFTVRTLSELRLALDRSSADSVLILGGGSNMVCSDAPFAGAVIEIALSGVHVSPSAPQGPEPLGLNAANITLDATTLPFRPSPEDNHVWLHVAAGEQWDAVVAAACRWGLGGIECLSGIPGKAGATPIQNVGAYGQEVGDTLWSVTCMERKTGRLRSFTAAECELSYRHSRFKTRDVDKYVVVELVLRLKLGTVGAIKYGEIARKLAGTESPSIEHVRQTVLATRAAKSMVLDPNDPNGRNCGSFFLNPIIERSVLSALQSSVTEPVPHFDVDARRVKVPAAWLIERAGFARGQRVGNVGLSTKHTLCLVAHDDATSAELLQFARDISAAVESKFGIQLKPEPILVGLDW